MDSGIDISGNSNSGEGAMGAEGKQYEQLQ
jgi:hypothetical protein